MRSRLGVFGGQITSTPFGWRQFGTSSNDEVNGIAVDSSGNSYLVGTTFGSFPGFTLSGTSDIFIAKYSNSGELLWRTQFGSSGADQGKGIAYDSVTDSIYVCGIAGGTISGQTHNGGEDAVIARYTSSGTQQWVRLVGSSSNDGFLAVAVDPYERVYAVGYAQGSIGGQTYGGLNDGLLVAYSSSGTQFYVRLTGQAPSDTMTGVCYVDFVQSVYIVGNVGSGTYFGSSYSDDAYISIYDRAGGRLSTTAITATSPVYAYGVTGKNNNGDVYVVGATNSALTGQTQTGTTDGYIIRLNSVGTVQERSQFGLASSTTIVNAIRCSPDFNNIFVAGKTNGSFTTNSGLEDLFIRKASSTSITTGITTVQYGTSSNDVAKCIDVTSSNVYIGGDTAGTLGIINSGGIDGFLGRLNTSLEIA